MRAQKKGEAAFLQEEGVASTLEYASNIDSLRSAVVRLEKSYGGLGKIFFEKN